MKLKAASPTPIYFLGLTALVQCIAAGILIFTAQIIRPQLTYQENWIGTLLITAAFILYGTIAWGTAVFLDLPPLWRVFNTLVLPLIAVFEVLNVPSPVYAGAVILAALLYLPTFWTRVPYYPSSQAMYEAVLKELPAKPVKFIDLGCGFSGMLCFLARARPDAEFTGVELSPLAYVLSKINVAMHGLKNVRIRYKNFWQMPLTEFNAVYAFLAPPPMATLWEKVQAELAKKGVFLVNSFPVPEVKAREIEVKGSRQVQLYRYDL